MTSPTLNPISPTSLTLRATTTTFWTTPLCVNPHQSKATIEEARKVEGAEDAEDAEGVAGVAEATTAHRLVGKKICFRNSRPACMAIGETECEHGL